MKLGPKKLFILLTLVGGVHTNAYGQDEINLNPGDTLSLVKNELWTQGVKLADQKYLERPENTPEVPEEVVLGLEKWESLL